MSNEFSGIEVPDQFNLADHLLDARVREGKGKRHAIITDQQVLTFEDVQKLANKFANVLRNLGVEQENRVVISLPDIPEFAGALFGILKLGAVVVMVNPQLKTEDMEYFLQYTRAKIAIVSEESYNAFKEAAKTSPHLKKLLTIMRPGLAEVGSEGQASEDLTVSFEELQKKQKPARLHKIGSACHFCF